MKPNINEMLGAQKGQKIQGQGPNWILIAGGALISTLSVRLGYRLKQAFDSTQPKNSSSGLKGIINHQPVSFWTYFLIYQLLKLLVYYNVENGKHRARKRPGNCHSHSHSNLYCFEQDDGCFNCVSGIEGDTETKPQHSGRLHTEPEVSLPLTTASAPVYTKENGVMWSSSPDRLELPQKPFHNFNSPESPCISESGSDIYSKREVIQKLRQQLKRRDDMILEMQDQIAELQSSVTSQRTRSDHLQSLLEAANRDLFDSEREIQRLRKVIADICAGTEKPNGNINGFQDLECLDKGIGGNVADKIEILKKEIGELKDLIEGKDYLLQNYKEQKSELSLKVKELQHRLDSQVANIF
ncbi:hypothetical protein HanPI659440_Chr15g0596311 [Helianthus annuus]|nr:hypothetical protein HanLR1_Chr15g0577271 [Helianthus annuus]KAJ0693365.1 hypothetical protein HanPI659440_Chr15g0596311 [Helianthus annuus]